MASKIHPLLMVPQDIMNECAERSRRLRIQQNITQQELAERVGVAVGTIKRFEKTGDLSLIPGSGRSPGGGLGNPLQYSCLENSMDRGA